jgi:hypothetical protein
VQALLIGVSVLGSDNDRHSDKFLVGIAKANEMLVWGKKKEAKELLDCGFIK